MQVRSKFPIAINTLLCMKYYTGKFKLTGEFLAEAVGVNPVIMRNTIGTLKAVGFVEVERGIGGATLSKKLKDITLWDVYSAFECNSEPLFKLPDTNQDCPIGANFEPAINSQFSKIEQSFEQSLKDVTLSEIYKDIKKRIKNTGVEVYKLG